MDAPLGIRVLGAMAANIAEYVVRGAAVCLLTGVAIGATSGPLVMLIEGIAFPSPVFLGGLVGLGQAALVGAIIGGIVNLFLGPPFFFVAACFAPAGEKNMLRRGSLFWEMQRSFVWGQAIGSAAFAGATAALCLAVKFVSGNAAFNSYFLPVVLIGIFLGIVTGSLVGTMRAISRAKATRRAEILRMQAAKDA